MADHQQETQAPQSAKNFTDETEHNDNELGGGISEPCCFELTIALKLVKSLNERLLLESRSKFRFC
ncbi:hypothetical protein DERP_011876 [Dermatophagoides pteronyssinus]|uniref:Uncharacterized protein n=1 Tax=Dermatophagoides pteronyssinus TaxID=6956 RepID=A0ABQ8JRY2_DERPT|nr:hypothetical protein DERP_011876 [Dermatophagoides pteronyssinus]